MSENVTVTLTREQTEALVEFGGTAFGPADLDNAHDEALDVLRAALAASKETNDGE